MKSLTPNQHRELIEKHKAGWSFKALANYFSISKTSAFFYYHGEVSNEQKPNDVQAPLESTSGRAN